MRELSFSAKALSDDFGWPPGPLFNIQPAAMDIFGTPLSQAAFQTRLRASQSFRMEGCNSGRDSWPDMPEDLFSSFYLLPASFSMGKSSPQGRGQGPHSPAGESWWGTKHKPSRIILEETVIVLGALISLNGSY